MPKTTVEFFISPDGRSPVTGFIDRCSDRQQVKILRRLQHLEEFGPTTAIPHSKKLTGTPLWELRILGRDNIRIVYAPLGQDKVAVLHIFLKKKLKTPRKEINIALNRYKQLFDK